MIKHDTIPGLTPTEVYDLIFQTIPANGNCWCHENRKSAPKGVTQDDYDKTCRFFHQCLHCGEYEGCTEPYETELNIDIQEDFSFTHPDFQHYINNFNETNGAISVYPRVFESVKTCFRFIIKL